MTDLEMTKLCAEAMGLEVAEQLGGMRFMNTQYESSLYDPLANDAQAMELVKRFELNVQGPTYVIPPRWHVWRKGDQSFTGVANVLELNRAICECVANMQKGK